MEAVLLAAGPGTRMRPLTHERPKNMLAVAGKPLLHHLVEGLKSAGATRIVLVVGHGDEHVRRYVEDGDRFGLAVEYVVQEEPLGLGHALERAKGHVEGQEFLLLAADAWYHPDLLLRLAQAKGPHLTVLDGGRSYRFGVPRLESGRAAGLRLVEPPVQEPPCAGAYRMPRRVLEGLSAQDLRLVETLDRDMRQNGPWGLVHAREHEYVDIREPPQLLEVHERLMHELPATAVEAPPGVHVEGPVTVGDGTVIRPGTVILGPAIIGNDCDIGPHVVIGPATAIRHRVRIGPFTFLERCSVASNTSIGSQCRIHSAIVDNGARLGHGARVDGGEGAIVGPDARLEDESHVLPEGRIGRAARVSAGRSVKEVPDGGVAV